MAIKRLEKSKIDMASISVLGKGLTEDRHVVGFRDAEQAHRPLGWLGRALGLGLGVASGAVGGAMSSIGIPEDGIPVYEADLRVS